MVAGTSPVGPIAQDRARVLVVDDDDDVRALVAFQVRSLGFDVVEASSAEDAESMLCSNPDSFSSIVTDEIMHGMKGSELIRRLRRAGVRTPAVVASGMRIEDDGSGFVLLTKPFSAQDLEAAIGAAARVATPAADR